MENTQVHVLSQALHIFHFHFGRSLEYFCLPLTLPFHDRPMSHILVIAGRFRHEPIILLSCVRTSPQL